VPYKGTGDMALAVMGNQIDGAMTYTAFAINNKGKVRALAVAMEKRHPLLPDVPTFKELGVDWVDGAYRGIGVPKSTPPEARKKMSDLWMALNTAQHRSTRDERAGRQETASAGQRDRGVDQMDQSSFMKDDQSPGRGARHAVSRAGPAHERTTAACSLPAAEVHSLPIEPTIVQKLTDLLDAGARLTEADNTPRFASLFAHVLDAQADSPIVFHCTAGKDRTGFAAALLQLALGVPQDVVMHDYLLTNARLAARGPFPGLPAPVAHVLHRVQPDFLQAAFDALEHDHGGLEAYLREGIGLDAVARKELQRLLLEP
jgi:hypothetical protein